MEQLREGKTPGPWRLITADRGVKFSRSIPSRCCCYCWSASNILFVEKGGQQTQTSAILSPRPLHEGFQIGFTKSRSGRDASVLCGYYPALALPPRLITSYVPARHPPTADGRQSRWWEYRSTFCYKRHLFTISVSPLDRLKCS